MKKNLMFLMMSIISISSFAQLIKEPYLIYTGNSETMKVMFQTEKPQVYMVSYGLTEQYEIGSAQISQLKKGENENIFTYTFKFLKPNSKYYYRIADKQKYKIHTGYFFSAKKPNDKKVYFSVVGNTSSNEIGEDLSKAIIQFNEKEKKFRSIVLHTGNLVAYGNSEKHWSQDFFNIDNTNTRKLYTKLPIVAVKGVNETKKCMFAKNKQLFRKYFIYPYASIKEDYYSLKYGNLKFIVLDQFADYDVNSAQFTWLTKELESDISFKKIILIHSIKKAKNSKINEFNTLLEKNNVKLVFTGNAKGYAHYKKGSINYFSVGANSFLKGNQNEIETIKSVSRTSFITVKYEGNNISIMVLDTNLKIIDHIIIE